MKQVDSEQRDSPAPGWWPLLRILVMIASWSCIVTWGTADHDHPAPRWLLLLGLGLLWVVVGADRDRRS